MELDPPIEEIKHRNLEIKSVVENQEKVAIFNEHIIQCITALEDFTGTDAAFVTYKVEGLEDGRSVNLHGLGSYPIDDFVVKNMALIINDANGDLTTWCLKVVNNKDKDGYQVAETTTSAANDEPIKAGIQALTDLVLFQYKDHLSPTVK